jgi:hypothetical protein
MPVILLATTSSIGLAGIDFYYSLNNVISNVYLVDGIIQILFVTAWVIVLSDGKKKTILKSN